MIKISAKQVKETFPRILSVPYGAAQNLLRFDTPCYYTAGVYGKNADVYCEGDAVIATGYRPFGKKARFVKKYEEKAGKFLSENRNADYKTQIEGLNKIILDWIQEEFAEGNPSL